MSQDTMQRRRFLKTATATAGFLLTAPYLGRAASDPLPVRTLKIGLVGCGGRGLGAVRNALDADPNVVVWALADAFQERLDFGAKLLKEQYGGRMQAETARQFVGLDAYRNLLEEPVDVVLLCTPPAFRPQHVAASIAAGKHLYVEKPVAVDVPGALSVLDSARMAKAQELVILDGFCWRYDQANKAAREWLREGQLGKVIAFDGLYYATPPKSPLALDSRPPHESDVSWALRNWTAWYWLSGGQFVEQAIHTVDGMMWSMGDQPPVAAYGSGGRAQRTDDGDVWDHYDVHFEYEHDIMGHIACRQWVGCHSEITDRTFCEKGILTTPLRPRIQAERRWRYRGEKTSMYANTHVAFYQYLRSGKWVQTLEQAAVKTLVAIMGRNAALTGQRITWDEITKDTQSLMPESLTMETSLPPASIPVPGKA